MRMPETRVVRVNPRGNFGVAIPVGRRAVIYGVLTSVAVLTAATLTLTLGDLGIPLRRLPVLLVEGPQGPETFVLERLRGPRVLVAVGAGAALAVAGTLFQTVTRNPLASPDIIGITAGAGAGAAAASLFWPGTVPVPVGAVAGAAVAAIAVYLSTGRGFSSPSRVIIAGIAVAAMAIAFTQYVVLIGMRDESTALATYIAGSLSARSWTQVATISIAIAVLIPLAMTFGQRLRLVEMGDDVADALGARAAPTRTWSIVVATALATAAVSVAGPVAFVSLTAPQIAKRCTKAPGANVVPTALTGAFILVIADLGTQHVSVVEDLPVGVLTAGIGGLYLGYLLTREWKRGTM